MIRLFVNGMAASAGGGLTYLRNVVPHLSRRGDVETTLAVSEALSDEFSGLPRISTVHLASGGGPLNRFWQEQWHLPKMLQESGADALISTGNFALRKSPVPQILLSRNSLYTSRDFYRDLRSRGEYRLWLDTKARGLLAKRSVHWADCTVTPSKAFAEELRRWTGKDIVPIYHGFDRELFFADTQPLPRETQQKLDRSDDALRLLFVSHYNYYRNFEILLRALPELKRILAPRQLRLLLTCDLSHAHGYRPDTARKLLSELRIEAEVIQLGAIPYRLLHHLYCACDLYVTPAYTETFAHPLVEAMASGLPIVASDIPVHREICESAALYFPRFSPGDLAQQIAKLVSNAAQRNDLGERGRNRVSEFSWGRHVEQMIDLVYGMAAGPRSVNIDHLEAST